MTAGAFEVVVGLEVHLALRTRSKLFCGCVADDLVSDMHNRHVCPVCLGLPGALPVPNAEAVTLALRFAAAIDCAIPPVTAFSRKHYGYPDAPKNYQISQFDRPVGQHGAIALPGGRRIGITRCHLEEDAGRLSHPLYADHSLVDFDRAGAPLLEMVTEPDLRSGEEARAFLEEVRAIARALHVSDATPEEGRMRADVNVSLRRPGEPLGTKVEVKNLNSFKSVQAAIETEVRRQTRLLEAGQAVVQETRGWNEGGQKTYLLRSKEEAADYRYLDDPDLPPMAISQEDLAAIRAATPETPARKRERYLAIGIKADDAQRLATELELSLAFDALHSAAQDATTAKAAPSVQGLANWLLVEVTGLVRGEGRPWPDLRGSPGPLVALVGMAEAQEISGPTAKALLAEVLDGADPRVLVEERGLAQISDQGALDRWVDEAMAAHPEVVATARSQPKALNFLMGQVMKASRGQARPEAVRARLEERLASEPAD